jgi:hypothetical protein
MGFARLKWRGEGFRQTWQGRPGPDPAVPMNRDCHIGKAGRPRASGRRRRRIFYEKLLENFLNLTMIN